MSAEVGRVAVKLAGRDAGKKCVIVEVLDGNFVLIDGETRRRKCNVKHLELLEQTVEISSGAERSELDGVFKDLGFDVWETKAKKPTAKPVRKRTVKPAKTETKKAKAPKKAEKAAPVEATVVDKKEAPKKKKATA